jgi:hypothetical protein
MKLHLERIYTCDSYTIGHLYQVLPSGKEKLICDTIEDCDRGLDDGMLEKDIKNKKVYSLTAIPTGTYTISMNIQSPKYSKINYYYSLCGGFLPRLLNVKGFTGILIHKGNTAADSAGCILPGYNKVKGKVINSQIAFEDLYKNYLLPAERRGDDIIIEITRKYKK